MKNLYSAREALPPELDDRIHSELGMHEKLIWAGRPRLRFFPPGSIFTMLFGSVFTAFALFWTTMAFSITQAGGAPSVVKIFFPAFGIPFILVGLGLLTSPYWARRAARRTCYAITSERAIVWRGAFGGRIEVRSYLPEELARMHRVENGDGSGDLVFAEEHRSAPTRRNRYGTHVVRHGFLDISDVRAVEAIVRETLLRDVAARA